MFRRAAAVSSRWQCDDIYISIRGNASIVIAEYGNYLFFNETQIRYIETTNTSRSIVLFFLFFFLLFLSLSPMLRNASLHTLASRNFSSHLNGKVSIFSYVTISIGQCVRFHPIGMKIDRTKPRYMYIYI